MYGITLPGVAGKEKAGLSPAHKVDLIRVKSEINKTYRMTKVFPAMRAE
jgi:hypothetical protein